MLAASVSRRSRSPTKLDSSRGDGMQYVTAVGALPPFLGNGVGSPNCAALGCRRRRRRGGPASPGEEGVEDLVEAQRVASGASTSAILPQRVWGVAVRRRFQKASLADAGAEADAPPAAPADHDPRALPGSQLRRASALGMST